MSSTTDPNTPHPPDYKAATEHLWKTYQVINEWIRFADAKAGALLTVNGVLIGAALGKIGGDQQFQAHQWLDWIVVALGITCSLCLIASAAFSLLCIKPILTIKTGAAQPLKKSTIYFEHIANHSGPATFYEAVLKIEGDEAAFKEIADQVYAVSKVATRKHIYIRQSIIALSVGFVLGVALLLGVLLLAQSHGGTP